MVRIHAHTMRSTTVHLMALRRLAAPTPMMAAEMLCVVDTGMPSEEAERIIVADAVSAAKPWMGCSLTILWPSVLMMRQPPAAVPAAITRAQATLIQVAISKDLAASSWMRRKPSQSGKPSRVPLAVAEASARAMMPMVFCASLEPWAQPMALAETICALAKKPLTKRGRPSFCSQPRRAARKENRARNRPMMTMPSMKPAAGEVSIGRMTLGTRPLPCHQCAPPGTFQMMAFQLSPAAASAAPHRPPTRACEDEDGRPHHQVIRFHTVAPARAQISTPDVTCTTPVSTRPEAMVLATAVPARAPSRLVPAASSTACAGLSTLVATTVAIELAVSWNPLMYSNTRATSTTARTRLSSMAGPQEFFSAIAYTTLPASRQRSMAFSRISNRSLRRRKRIGSFSLR